ncbi:MAG: RidA family protein [Pseudomonadota bacterium]
MIEYVTAKDASPPHGHYSHATVHDGKVYVCGLLGNSLEEHQGAKRSVAVQTDQCLRDLSIILEVAKSDLSQVLQATVYVNDIENWPEINQVWERWFGNARPARAVVPTPPLRYNSALELVVIAAVAR